MLSCHAADVIQTIVALKSSTASTGYKMQQQWRTLQNTFTELTNTTLLTRFLSKPLTWHLKMAPQSDD